MAVTFRLWRADASTNYEPAPAGEARIDGARAEISADPQVTAVIQELCAAPTLSLKLSTRAHGRQTLLRRDVGPDEPEWGFAVGDETARRTGLEVTYDE